MCDLELGRGPFQLYPGWLSPGFLAPDAMASAWACSAYCNKRDLAQLCMMHATVSTWNLYSWNEHMCCTALFGVTNWVELCSIHLCITPVAEQRLIATSALIVCWYVAALPKLESSQQAVDDGTHGAALAASSEH